jgi:hypothetical protein
MQSSTFPQEVQSSDSYSVSIVLDRSRGTLLPDLLNTGPVWAVDSPDSDVFFSECGGSKNGLSGQLIANDIKVCPNTLVQLFRLSSSGLIVTGLSIRMNRNQQGNAVHRNWSRPAGGFTVTHWQAP